jgi:CMP-N-acetylneuraminic acid synthetase
MCELAGHPLLYWTIKFGQVCSHIDSVVVSSNEPEILQYCETFKNVKIIERPQELSDDHSQDIEAFEHCLSELKKLKHKVNDYVVHLRATNPFRKLWWMDEIIQILSTRPDIDTIRSVEEAADTPFKMWLRDDQKLMSPVAPINDIPFAHSQPRQNLPKSYRQNAHLDIIRTDVLSAGKIVGKKIYGYETVNDLPDIDLPVDLQVARENFSDLIDQTLLG